MNNGRGDSISRSGSVLLAFSVGDGEWVTQGCGDLSFSYLITLFGVEVDRRDSCRAMSIYKLRERGYCM
jgi:hypothetical protein